MTKKNISRNSNKSIFVHRKVTPVIGQIRSKYNFEIPYPAIIIPSHAKSTGDVITPSQAQARLSLSGYHVFRRLKHNIYYFTPSKSNKVTNLVDADDSYFVLITDTMQ